MAASAYVGLGSNLNHPRRHVARALAELSRLPRSRLVVASPNYVSAPVGCVLPQPDYVNAVALLRTRLSPRNLLSRLHAIERRHRRDQTARALRNAPRTLDLDLLLYGRLRLRQRDLSLPHPRMHLRAFVLRPLRDIAPTMRVPGRGATPALLRRVRDQRVYPTRRHAWR